MPVHLTREDLIAVCPPPKAGPRREIWDGYVKAILSPEGRKLFEKFHINTPLRMTHLLATWAAETNLCILWESGAYSATSIVRVFGPGRHSAGIGLGEAKRIAALPVGERTKVLFERVYGEGNPKKARTLGNTQPGDGWRFRGLGLNQITGRWAHEKSAREIGCNLDDLAMPINCIHAALLEWQRKGCNAFADKDDAVSIRKLINAGSLKVSVSRINGLPNAMAAVSRAKRVIGPDDVKDEAEELPPYIADKTPDAPDTIGQSTEAQTAVVIGGGGTYQVTTEFSNAAASLAARGQPVTLTDIVLQLASSPAFWVAAITIAGSVYWIFRRRAKLLIHGV